MTRHEFHNAVRILTSIDLGELVDAGVLPVEGGGDEWQRFRADPFRWFTQASDAQAEALWRIVTDRQPRPRPAAKRTDAEIASDLKATIDRVNFLSGEAIGSGLYVDFELHDVHSVAGRNASISVKVARPL